ncbi:MAG: hypothetical protein WBA97_31025 [Actinophytocola sp.]|uniref:hypothetical protein n=1 Tax=Actinophytocola sp. TaxID=1872138 RepID=UPI003C70A177
MVLYEATLDDVSDVSARPVNQLARWRRQPTSMPHTVDTLKPVESWEGCSPSWMSTPSPARVVPNALPSKRWSRHAFVGQAPPAPVVRRGRTQRRPALAEQVDRPELDDSLPTKDRRAALHVDLARAYAQADVAHDAAALRHLDLADRIAPQRVRLDPTARETVHDLDMRSRLRTWKLTSLKNRLGVGLHVVNN